MADPVNVLEETCAALGQIHRDQIAWTVDALRNLRADRKARVFCIGNGGGYAHATHLASDLTKIARIPSLAFDNGAELTARVNDQSWAAAWTDWLTAHRFNHHDGLFVFSVGGGAETTSANLTGAITYASGTWTEAGDAAPILGVVGAAGGELAKRGWPIVVPSTSTPVIEGCQSVIAHHLVEQLCS